jgi:lipoate-protein ligase A
MENQTADTEVIWVPPVITAGAARQMALDLLWLEHTPARGAVYRSYYWAENTATFGYFQKASIVSNQAPRGWTIQRRPTGGGIVLHSHGFTYTLCVSSQHPWYRVHAETVYRSLHLSVVDALAQCEVSAKLAEECVCADDGIARCQEQPVKYDVLDSSGRHKLAGAAMKRNRHGLLFQGQLWAVHAPQILQPEFHTAMAEAFSRSLQLPLHFLCPETPLLWSAREENERVEELASK